MKFFYIVCNCTAPDGLNDFVDAPNREVADELIQKKYWETDEIYYMGNDSQ